ncbi:MAG: hypothetical protein OXG74_11295 [Acidobacteria bacterium]|nr:hypothetical protein [Acidobacteriota bacterium]
MKILRSEKETARVLEAGAVGAGGSDVLGHAVEHLFRKAEESMPESTC